MTAMPCGQKNRTRDMIQSQMVTPPLAAIEGTTFRLKTATTKRRTRSRRPRARIKCGWATGWAAVVDKFPLGSPRFASARQPRRLSLYEHESGQARGRPRSDSNLVRDRNWRFAFLLRLRKRCCDVVERGEVLVDIGLGVLDRNRPLLIPPVGLRHHAAVDHGKPIVPPQVDVDGGPVAIVADFFGIKHQGAVGSGL